MKIGLRNAKNLLNIPAEFGEDLNFYTFWFSDLVLLTSMCVPFCFIVHFKTMFVLPEVIYMKINSFMTKVPII